MSRWILMAVLGLMPLLALAQVNSLPAEPSLLVKGHSEGRYVPDRFTIKLRVEATNMSPDVARAKVEEHMRQLFGALDSSGAMQDRTQASTLSIEPDTTYRDQDAVFVGTKVSRSLSATFDSADKLRAFISQVPANKEVQIQSVDVNRSDIDKIHLDLRKRAIEDSQRSAKQIAAAYGVSLEGVYSISDVAPDYSYGVQAMPTAIVTGSNYHPKVAMQIGTMDEKQDIYVVYLIRQSH
jgi:uncharacterized protein